MSQPPDTSATPSTAATITARDRIALPLSSPRTVGRALAALGRQREKSGPALTKQRVHARGHLALGSARVYDRDRAALWMTLLPLDCGESPEFRGDAGVKFRGCLLDAVVRSAPSDTPKSLLRGEIEEHCEIGCEATGGHPVRRGQIIVRNAPPGALVR